MTMHKALHPRDDIEWLYESRNGGGRGFTGIEDYEAISIKEPEEYNKKTKKCSSQRPVTALAK